MASETDWEKADPGRRYRLVAQAGDRREEGLKVDADEAHLLPVSESDQPLPKRRFWIRLGLSGPELILAGVSVVLFIALAALLGQGNSLISRGQVALVALVPLLAVTLILGWIDRWAPLRWRYKILGLIWGGGIAAGAAIVVNTGLYTDALLSSGDLAHATFLASVVVAPLSEEAFKGIGAVLVLLLARGRLSSPLSGMALGGLVGAGFAYLENLQYFLEAMNQGSTVFGFTVFARGVMSPFIHPMATSLTALAAASALLRPPGPWGWLWRIALGLGGAITVHALWNWSASVGPAWLLIYFLVQIPLFSAWMFFIIRWAGRQPRQIADGLTAYVQTGWITVAEVRMVVDPLARKYAKKWGKTIGAPAPRLVRRFSRRLGYLGLDQALMTKRGPNPRRIEADREYLRDVEALREEFRALEALHSAGATGRGSAGAGRRQR